MRGVYDVLSWGKGGGEVWFTHVVEVIVCQTCVHILVVEATNI